VLEAVNVALPGGKLLVPDVVVVAAGAVGETATRLPCAAVLAVVEVVSPSTMAIDRAVKPVRYAEAGGQGDVHQLIVADLRHLRATGAHVPRQRLDYLLHRPFPLERTPRPPHH
jgi:hypothetical protein